MQGGKAKGVENLIQVENPNRVQKKTKKLSQLNQSLDTAKPELSRRERYVCNFFDHEHNFLIIYFEDDFEDDTINKKFDIINLKYFLLYDEIKLMHYNMIHYFIHFIMK